MVENDPVHQDQDGTWWFWEETWTHRNGPYTTEEKAREQLADYTHWLETGEER